MKRFANVGCGARNFGPEWLHIDGGDFEHLDGNDIFNLPCPDGSLDICYSSHLVSYVEDFQLQSLLRHWKSKLKPGGILRIATPDFEAMVKYYESVRNVRDLFGPIFGFMYMGERIIYHKQFFDFNYLRHWLENIGGFENVRRYDFNKTEHSDHDDHSKAHLPHDSRAIAANYYPADKFTLISLNVEATKPIR